MTPLPKITFQQIVKYPTTWLLVMAIFAVGFIFNTFIGNVKKNDDDCETEKRELRQENRNLTTKLDELTTALLIKNGVINEVKKQTDSIVRIKVGDEAKKIVN